MIGDYGKVFEQRRYRDRRRLGACRTGQRRDQRQQTRPHPATHQHTLAFDENMTTQLSCRITTPSAATQH
ncbi:MAG: hypothetical protein WB710_11575 [Stellaceae bacterium]